MIHLSVPNAAGSCGIRVTGRCSRRAGSAAARQRLCSHLDAHLRHCRQLRHHRVFLRHQPLVEQEMGTASMSATATPRAPSYSPPPLEATRTATISSYRRGCATTWGARTQSHRASTAASPRRAHRSSPARSSGSRGRASTRGSPRASGRRSGGRRATWSSAQTRQPPRHVRRGYGACPRGRGHPIPPRRRRRGRPNRSRRRSR